jgi:hypothetical protein
MTHENPPESWQHAAMPPFEFARDVFSRDGFTMLVDGQSQSHVDPGDPARLFFEYVRRIGNVVDAFRIPGAPIRALHLGGGGLSLPRYVEATRPGSTQVVVEHDGALLEAVLARVPLPRDADIELVVADARAAVAGPARGVAEPPTGRHESSAQSPDTPGPNADTPTGALQFRRLATQPPRANVFDLVTVDLYSGLEPPEFVASHGFARDVLALLAPDGIVVVNVADAAGLARLRAQARAYARAAPTAELLVAGEPAILAGADEGNAILVVAPGGLPADLERRLAAAGPHPADVLTRDRLDFVLWGAC